MFCEWPTSTKVDGGHATVGLADKQSWSFFLFLFFTSEDNHQYVGFGNKKQKKKKKTSTRDREAMKLPVRTEDYGAWSVPLE